ncbi:MAG: hypothetical protein AAF191_17910 [Verrucomicrobiota bacterium]
MSVISWMGFEYRVFDSVFANTGFLVDGMLLFCACLFLCGAGLLRLQKGYLQKLERASEKQGTVIPFVVEKPSQLESPKKAA